MRKYGIHSVLFLLVFIFGIVAGRILFDSSVVITMKLFVCVFSVFFAIACTYMQEFLDELEFEQWKRRRGYVD